MVDSDCQLDLTSSVLLQRAQIQQLNRLGDVRLHVHVCADRYDKRLLQQLQRILYTPHQSRIMLWCQQDCPRPTPRVFTQHQMFQRVNVTQSSTKFIKKYIIRRDTNAMRDASRWWHNNTIFDLTTSQLLSKYLMVITSKKSWPRPKPQLFLKTRTKLYFQLFRFTYSLGVKFQLYYWKPQKTLLLNPKNLLRLYDKEFMQ